MVAPTNHRELLAWQEAIKLAVLVYGETAGSLEKSYSA